MHSTNASVLALNRLMRCRLERGGAIGSNSVSFQTLVVDEGKICSLLALRSTISRLCVLTPMTRSLPSGLHHGQMRKCGLMTDGTCSDLDVGGVCVLERQSFRA